MGLGVSCSDASEMLSGEAEVGGVELNDATWDEVSVGGPEKLDSDGNKVPISAITRVKCSD